LKTTRKLWLTAVAITLSGGAFQVAARAQTAPAKPPAEGREAADDLLRRAQVALEEGNYELADSLVTRAEKMNVKYSWLHTGPTPAKMRKALDQKRGAAGGGKLPSARFNPLAAKNAKPIEQAAPPRDPFDARQVDAAVDRLADTKQEAIALVKQGRKAFSERDFLLAEHYARKAAQFGAKFEPSEDSPQRLLADIQSSGAVVRVSAQEPQANPYFDTPAAQIKAIENSAPRATTEVIAPGFGQKPAASAGPPAQPQSGPKAAVMDKRDESHPMQGAPSARDVRDASRYDVRPSDYQKPTPSTAPKGYNVEQGLYRPQADPTRNIRVQAEEEPSAVVPPLTRTPDTTSDAQAGVGQKLFDQGLTSLRDGDKEKALHFFREAYNYRSQLDPPTLQRLQEHLQLLSVRSAPNQPGRGPETIETPQQKLARQLSQEVARRQYDARKMLEADPKRAHDMLKQTHKLVGEAQLDPPARQSLLARIDRSIVEVENYLKDHQFELDLVSQNNDVLREVERRKAQRLEIDDKLKAKVEEFNKLLKEGRYAEAEVLAKRAAELDPKNVAVVIMNEKARFVREFMTARGIQDAKRTEFARAMNDVEGSAIPFTDEFKFPNIEDWEALTKNRAKYGKDGRLRFNDRERAIEEKLKSPVLCQFKDQPIGLVIHELGKMAGIPVHLDSRGLEDLGVSADQKVTLNLSQEVSLKSALNLILEPLELGYMIRDEVLKVTSAQRQGGDVYQTVYPVADLVIPIPNFVPTARMGLSGALFDAHNRLGGAYNTPGIFGAPPAMAVATADGAGGNATIDPALLAQMNAHGTLPGARTAPISVGGGGPGGLGGGSQADFEAIKELITTTVNPPSWDAAGGSGSIREFENNLTLVISQTQDVHEEIVDLLEQLRRLQDLQVTIEVRFITLRDDFFERIGIDFDFNIDDNVGVQGFKNAAGAPTVDLDGDGVADIAADPGQDFNGDFGNGITIGIQQQAGFRDLNGDGENDPEGNALTGGLLGGPLYTADLDLQFRQGSFGGTAPIFGGFNPATAATFGFAILSDIEAFFFITAAQGDRRTNVMQAPKVTLFNGQQAYVSDTRQIPFVTSVIPVVGDFAAAQQPVIVVLNEGTALTLQAVVSNDRRFVRLTVVPFFSRVGDVDTFTFNGKQTTITGTSSTTDADTETPTSEEENRTVINEGTTVQLPTFEFVTVSTTVSVPDGGTVLLGGVKRLREERREQGVPMLSKLPYISRLFKNVGIGRETESLMMMVTPRIIIQEEEEQKLGSGAGQ
jgi:general secretion pathway protein D